MKTYTSLIFHVFVLFLLTTLVFTACGQEEAGVQESPPEEPEAVPTQAQAPESPLQPTLPPLQATETPAVPKEGGQPAQADLPFDKWSLWSGETQLRGANIYQRRAFLEVDGPDFIGPGPFGPPYTQADFDRLAALGANYVNLSIAGLYTLEPPYEVDEEAVANLDRLLEMAAQAHMYAVISFRTGPGRSEFAIIGGVGEWVDESYLFENIWTDSAAQAAWAEMWRFTAERYKDNPVVVGYDLMCEPNSNAMFDIWNSDEFNAQYGDSGYDWNSWYPSVVDAIREVDRETPILVSAMSYGDITWLPALQVVEDERIVYAFHQYSPHMYTHQEPGEDPTLTYPGEFDTDYNREIEAFDLPWLENLLSIASDWMAGNDKHLSVNEYGAVRWSPGAAQYLRDEMELFENNGWNYAVWSWYPEWLPLREGDNSFNYRLGPDPANLDEVVSSEILDALGEFWARNIARP